MFSHDSWVPNNPDVSKSFTTPCSAPWACPAGVANKNRYFYRSPTGTFGITTPINGEPATHGNGSTIGFGPVARAVPMPATQRAWPTAA